MSGPLLKTVLGKAYKRGPARRRGLGAVEVLVVLAILFVLLAIALVALPRQREAARLASCRKNLMQIGIGLALYDRSQGALPVPHRLEPLDAPARSAGPLLALLQALALPDLSELTDSTKAPQGRPGPWPAARFIPGFVCPSDPTAADGRLPAPTSYRACAGDRPDGRNGAFAPGTSFKLADAEAGDGLAFTAAFAERLLGNPRGPSNYAVMPVGPLDLACRPFATAVGRDDAGSPWTEAGWRATLYNHALTPNQGPSCIDPGGQAAILGASSGHPNGSNVLLLDGSVKTWKPTVSPPIWKALATANGEAVGPATDRFPAIGSPP